MSPIRHYIRGALLCLVFLLARSPPAAAIDPALVEAARKEGKVIWYSTLIVNQIVRPMVEAFEAKFPDIKVQYSRATSSDTALKIINEARANRVQADVFDGSATVFLLQEANLVGAYKPQEAAAYPDDLKDKDGYWTAANMFYMTVGYNTNLVKPDEVPRSFEDLLHPRWKGQMAWTTDPTANGPPGFTHNILTVMGQEKGMDYLRRLAAQKPVPIPAAQRVVLDKVISGEYPLGLMIFNHHSAISAAQGAPVAWVKMEPLSATFNTVSVVKAAPHPNAARLLVEFILSIEGQKVMAEAFYLPAHPAVPAKVPELKPDAGKFRITLIPPDMVRDHLREWAALADGLFK